MKTICCGYYKKNGTLVTCGKVIVEGPDNNISHGLCDNCFADFKEDFTPKPAFFNGLNEAGIYYIKAWSMCPVCLDYDPNKTGICDACKEAKIDIEKAVA